MSEINERMIGEFLELLKKVNSLEMQVQGIAKDHSEIMIKSTKVAQSIQDTITDSLKKQNKLVTDTNDSLATQVNEAMSKVNQLAQSSVQSHLNKYYDASKFERIENHINSLEEQVKKFMNIIGNLSKAFTQAKSFEEHVSPVTTPITTSIDDVALTTRTIRCLWSEKIYTLEDLIQRRPSDLLKISNLGRKSLKEIESVLRNLGLSLKDVN